MDIKKLNKEELAKEIKTLEDKKAKQRNFSTNDKIQLKKLIKAFDTINSPMESSGVFIPESETNGPRKCKIDVNKIRPNPNQPRKYFNEEKLQELKDSIVEHGLLQPIVVDITNGVHTLIAGERRLKAHVLAAIPKIDVIEHKNCTRVQFKELALIENLQRDDLNCMEESLAFNELHEEGVSVRDISTKLSKTKTYIHNRMILSKYQDHLMSFIIHYKLFNISALLAILECNLVMHEKLLNRLKNKDITTSEIKEICKSQKEKKEIKEAKKSKEKKEIPYPFGLSTLPGLNIKSNNKTKIDISIDITKFDTSDTSALKGYIENIIKNIKYIKTK